LPASGTAPGASPLTGNVDTETEFSFLTVETGIPGMLVLTGFTINLLLLGLRRCRHEPDREARMLLAALVAPVAGILALFFSSALTPTTPAGPYLWAVGGIVAYWLVALPAARRRGATLDENAQPASALE
jgi:O-antigen ligase